MQKKENNSLQEFSALKISPKELKICQLSKKNKVDNKDLEEFTINLPQQETNEHEIDIIIRLKKYVPNLEGLTVLDLSHCNLKAIPLSLKILQLKELNLSHNLLVKVPQCLYQGLLELEVINLSHNSLGSFDLEPYCLRNLKVLILDYNKLSNPPEWFLQMKGDNLEEFSYNCNNVTLLKRLDFPVKDAKLRKLHLCSCNIDARDLQFIKSFANLKYLNLSNISGHKWSNNFTQIGDLFKNAAWIDELEVLALRNLYISKIPASIAQLKKLKELDLQSNQLIEIPFEISLLKNLTKLDVSKNEIYGACNLSAMENLQVFDASYNVINSLIINNENLKVLDLYANEIEEVSLKFDNLEEVDLEQNYWVPCEETYEAKKTELRLRRPASFRIDGPKKEVAASESSNYDDYSRYSSEDFSEEDQSAEQGNSIHRFNLEDEDSWDNVQEDLYGVTNSDNEYVGPKAIISDSFRKLNNNQSEQSAKKIIDFSSFSDAD